ncbi:MAG: Spy/CpxP family protein refolding chaperone, partial [Betaproteobacteria bacterium]|nr:Spy/CpxP family protein refolding chaperone [Betaproteobacteria bacterium]
MNSNRKVIAGLITAAALAASGSFVYAQAEKGPGPGAERSGMHHGPHGGGEGRGHHGQWSNPKAAVEGHLAALKIELKITPAQENAWQTFATKSRQQADVRIAQHEKISARKPDANVAAPDRLAQRTERMKQHVASMEARTAAVKDLYAVLTPEQKAIADKQ